MISIEVFAGTVTKSACLKLVFKMRWTWTHKPAAYLAADGARVFWEGTHWPIKASSYTVQDRIILY